MRDLQPLGTETKDVSTSSGGSFTINYDTLGRIAEYLVLRMVLSVQGTGTGTGTQPVSKALVRMNVVNEGESDTIYFPGGVGAGYIAQLRHKEQLAGVGLQIKDPVVAALNTTYVAYYLIDAAVANQGQVSIELAANNIFTTLISTSYSASVTILGAFTDKPVDKFKLSVDTTQAASYASSKALEAWIISDTEISSLITSSSPALPAATVVHALESVLGLELDGSLAGSNNITTVPDPSNTSAPMYIYRINNGPFSIKTSGQTYTVVTYE